MTVEELAVQKRKGSGGRAWASAGSHEAHEGSPRRPGVQGPGLARLSKEVQGQASSGETETDPGLRARPRDACEPSERQETETLKGLRD